GAAVVPLLLMGLRDEDPRVRRVAAGGLEFFKKEAAVVVPALVKELDARDCGDRSGSSVAGNAARGLMRFPDRGADIVPALIRAAKAEHARLRRAAIWSLGYFPKLATTVEPVLKRALNDEDLQVRAQAEASLSQLRR